jgi:drug/metabolite transporter (DMT)-like permease
MTIGFLFAIGAAVTWGLVYTIDQKILTELTPITLLLVDSILGLLIALPFIGSISGSFKSLVTTGKTEMLLIGLSLVLAAFANFFIYSSIKHLGASRASLFEIAYPVFVVLFGMLFFKTSPNIYFFIGGALILIGAGIIVKFS